MTRKFPHHWTTVHTLTHRLEHVMACAQAHPHNRPLQALVRELSEELDRLLDDQDRAENVESSTKGRE
jgi:hypothetical protein